jgi:hypothetical protein
MQNPVGQIPFVLIILALFAAYGVLVRRGTIKEGAIIGAGTVVGALAVALTIAYWWPMYQRGLPLSLFLVNPVAMTFCAIWCIALAYRSQRVEDIATHVVGDTKVIVRVCPPSRLPDADALLLPTNTTLQMSENIAGLVGTATGPAVAQEIRGSGPVGPLKVVPSGGGNLEVGHIYHVAVNDYLRPVNQAQLRRGIEHAALQARKANAESVIVPIAPMRGLNIPQVTEALAGGVLKQRKAFAEIVVAVLSPRLTREVAAEVARQVAALEAASTERTAL